MRGGGPTKGWQRGTWRERSGPRRGRGCLSRGHFSLFVRLALASKSHAGRVFLPLFMKAFCFATGPGALQPQRHATVPVNRCPPHVMGGWPLGPSHVPRFVSRSTARGRLGCVLGSATVRRACSSRSSSARASALGGCLLLQVGASLPELLFWWRLLASLYYDVSAGSSLILLWIVCPSSPAPMSSA